MKDASLSLVKAWLNNKIEKNYTSVANITKNSGEVSSILIEREFIFFV